MQHFLSWPAATITRGLYLGLALLLLALALSAWRAPLLFRLAARNLPRRRLRMALIICGLALSTMVIGSALGTGDAMTYTIRSLVAGSLGSIDEVVVRDPPRSGLRERLRALAEPGVGGLAAVELSFFSRAEAGQLAEATRASGAIAATLPAILEQVSVIHQPSQQLFSSMPLLAVDAAEQAAGSPAFGALLALDGAVVNLGTLRQDEVVINQAAAALLQAQAGQPLQLLHGDQRWDVVIAAVVQNQGLVGTSPLLLRPLAHQQALMQRESQVNLLLVANYGGAASLSYAEQATSELRNLLADHEVARQLHEVLSQPGLQRALVQLEGSLQGRERTRIAALRAELARPEPSERFIALISEPQTRQRLASSAWRLQSNGEHPSPARLLQNLTQLSVLSVKQEAINQAQEFGAVISTVFLVLGLFSIAASVLLIFLIFALLAVERGAEMATLRAMGMRRRQIMSLFLLEGQVYNLLGCALGALLSLASSYVVSSVLARRLEHFGLQLARQVEPASLLIAFAAGVLLTFGSMVLAAWRVSHSQIVAATRGEVHGERGGWLVGLGLLFSTAGASSWWRWHSPALAYAPRHPLVLPGALSLGLLGLACLLMWLQRRRAGAPGERLLDGIVTLVGLALTVIWLRTLLALPTAGGELRADAVTSVAGVLALVLVLTWTAVRALAPLLRGLDRLLLWLPRLRVLVRPAAGYLSGERWRTGLTLLMFSMVICLLVSSLTLVHVLLNAFDSREPPVAGFELRGDVRAGAALGDLQTALREAPAVSGAAFSAIGSLVVQQVQAVPLGRPLARWQGASLQIVDQGFLSGIQAGVQPRDPDYADARAAWSALQTERGAALITGRGLPGLVPRGGLGRGETLEPFTLWVYPQQGGSALKLRVIGVVDPRSELDSGIYVSRATAQALGVPLEAPRSYFFAVRPGLRLRDVAQGLRFSLEPQGLAVSDLGDLLRVSGGVRLLLTRLIQSFMGLGLSAGVAALALLGVQAVLERRQQLGTLRALGLTRRQTQAMLSLEFSAIAALGLLLGLGLGLLLARSVVALLAERYPQLRFSVPWSEISPLALATWLAASLAITLAAWRAGRVAPAEALREG